MRLLYLLVLFVFLDHLGFSQQPFKKYGYEVEVITLSKGKYNEDFTTDSLVQVGSVILNRVTGKVVSFVTYDTLYSEATLDPQLVSRWMSPDPLAEQYYSWSPYNFVANNPINNYDPDGREVYFLNEGNARAVMNDLNTIFRKTYGLDYDLFNLETRTEMVTKTVEKAVEFDLFDPDTWDGVTEKQIQVEEERSYITTNNNSDFDWNTDKYAAATFDVFNTETQFKGQIVSPDLRVGKLNETMSEQKGHAIKRRNTVLLSSDLNKANANDLHKLNNKWSFGGTALHELVHHFHPLGDTEGSAGLQRRYNQPRSRMDHPGGVITKWTQKEKDRLARLRKKKRR